jgi:hypothetical protein
MDDLKAIEQAPAWLLTADRYIAEITRNQRVRRWRAIAAHVKAGQDLPRSFLASRAGRLNAPASLSLQ